MAHVLDNPAFNALISGNQNLANGSDDVKYFDIEVSPFAGLRDNSEVNFAELRDILPHEKPILFVSPNELDIPAGWKQVGYIKGRQMVFGGDAPGLSVDHHVTPLTNRFIHQMLELTRLTNPGPFNERTIEFGHYEGILENGNLVAMAGQRLHVFDYTEVSAVCTHPDHLGKGYANHLLTSQIRRMKAAGKTPYLHVRYDNERAIKVYERLGFATRIIVHFYVMKKV